MRQQVRPSSDVDGIAGDVFRGVSRQISQPAVIPRSAIPSPIPTAGLPHPNPQLEEAKLQSTRDDDKVYLKSLSDARAGQWPNTLEARPAPPHVLRPIGPSPDLGTCALGALVV